jgi:1,4-alpha-glucan branching enzyme
MRSRTQKKSLDIPISIYEVHLGSWKRDEKTGWGFLSYRELARQLVDYVKAMGYTHIELMPVMEHPLDESWGYQVVNYYAPTSRFGRPEDFMYFIDICHQNGIGVILDWVPAHFPKDMHGLNDFDGRQIYAYENWKKGEHPEWGTLVFDFGRNEVRNFLISNALFWLDKYHVDGLRVDAVASMLYLDYSRKPGEWEPNRFGGHENLEAIDFLKKFNEVVHGRFPGILTIAEESTAFSGVSRPTSMGGLGFSLKWNMGWMHDTLEYVRKDPIYRSHHQGMLSFSLLYAFSENFALPFSHDEVVYGKRSLLDKMPGDVWQKFANLRLLLGYMYAHPGKKLLFMTDDFGQWSEWDAGRSLDWHLLTEEPHQKINRFVRDLNAFYRSHRALFEADFEPQGFEWVDFSDANASVISFLRLSRDREELLLFTCNMTPVPRPGYRIGVPRSGFYREVLNSNAAEYGGSGTGNFGGVHSENISWHGRPFSIRVDLPPLAVNAFRYAS